MSGVGDRRRRRLRDAYLYLCCGRRDDLGSFLDAALRGGVDVVQLRDKEADEVEIRLAAAVFRRFADRHGALFLLNDEPELAAEVGADGVHVGQADSHPDVARAAVGPDRLVGRSTHGQDEIDRALGEDCDYFAVGPVHATPTKKGRAPIGLAPLRHAAGSAGDRPWFVTGGMGPETASAALAAGARRLVVVRALTEAADPEAVARGLADLLRSPGR